MEKGKGKGEDNEGVKGGREEMNVLWEGYVQVWCWRSWECKRNVGKSGPGIVNKEGGNMAVVIDKNG